MKTIDQELRLSVAATVRAELARRDLNQWDLAGALGLNRTGASRRLRGEVPFDTDELAAIGGLLDMPPAEILEIAWEAIRGKPCFLDSDDSPDGSMARHPTGTTSLLIEAERLISDPPRADQAAAGDMAVTAA